MRNGHLSPVSEVAYTIKKLPLESVLGAVFYDSERHL